MKPDFKNDWEICLDLHETWWRRRDTGRPLMMEWKYKDGWRPDPVVLADENAARAYWANAPARVGEAEREMVHRIYTGAAFPYFVPQLGPGSLGLFLGATPHFSPQTVWYDPCFADIREARAVLNPANPWLAWTMDATRQALQRAQECFLVAFPDLVEGLDCAAALIGSQPLLFALADAPSEAHRLMREITDCWYKAFDGLYALVNPPIGGNAFMAFEIVGRGKTAKLQCDLSAMLSPAMFHDFVVPYLAEQAEWLDYALYHLDGPTALQHLDALCSIDALDCIQWMPGAGVPWGQDPCWDGVYRKILDAGKGLMAYMPQEYVDGFIRKFGTRGVYIAVSG